jgi:hypothetical protein
MSAPPAKRARKEKGPLVVAQRKLELAASALLEKKPERASAFARELMAFFARQCEPPTRGWTDLMERAAGTCERKDQFQVRSVVIENLDVATMWLKNETVPYKFPKSGTWSPAQRLQTYTDSETDKTWWYPLLLGSRALALRAILPAASPLRVHPAWTTLFAAAEAGNHTADFANVVPTLSRSSFE